MNHTQQHAVVNISREREWQLFRSRVLRFDPVSEKLSLADYVLVSWFAARGKFLENYYDKYSNFKFTIFFQVVHLRSV